MIKRASLLAAAGLVLCSALGIGAASAAPSFQDRIIVDAMAYPWSALGRVNTGGQGHCTGVLVGRSHVLTQAHCLYNATEGRWWSPSELHFVAGYQRDSYRIHSGVRRTHVAPDYQAGQAVLANLKHNWAVLSLDRPIGLRAGWIGVQRRNRNAVARLERGEAYVIDAGYRAGQSHVITLTPDCSFDTLLRHSGTNLRGCQWLSAEVGLAKLIFFDGEFRALVPSDITHEVVGHNLQATRPIAHMPPSGSPARRQSQTAILHLLQRVGFTGGRVIARKNQPSEPAGGSQRSTYVHLGSLRSEELANQEWTRLKRIFPMELAKLDLTVEQADIETKGIFYRVLADAAQGSINAQELCNALRKTDQYCAMIRPSRAAATTSKDDGKTSLPTSATRDSGWPASDVAARGADKPIAAPESSDGAFVHLASLRSERLAEQEWLRLKKIFDKQLAEFDLTVERVELEAKGTFYRVLVNLVQSPYSAQQLCTELRQINQYCTVLKPIDIHFESS